MTARRRGPRPGTGQPSPRCEGVFVWVLDGMTVTQSRLACLGHDPYGNHLVRDPDGQERWAPR